MNRNALLAATGVAIIALASVGLYMKKFELEAAGGNPVEILMVTGDVSLGEPLTIQFLATRQLPEAYVEDRHILAADRERILGIRTSTQLRANQSLLWTDLTTNSGSQRELSGLLREGMRAFTVKANSASSLGGMLRPGDRVDVILTAQRPNDFNIVSVGLLQNLLVLAVGLDTGGPDQAVAGNSVPHTARSGVDVTIAVTMEQATMIVHGKDRGELLLVLRNPEDVEVLEGLSEVDAFELIDPQDDDMAPVMRGLREPDGPVAIE